MAKRKKPKTSNNPIKLFTPTEVKKENNKLLVSFEHLCLNNKKYNMDEIGDNKIKNKYYQDFYEKILEYSKYDNFKKYISENGIYRDKNHIHQIKWNDNRINENAFTSLNTNLMEQIKDDCWQLGINNDKFRIHGFFIDNVFYLVWLDPLHHLYPLK